MKDQRINLSPEAAICPACGEPNCCGAVAAGRHDVACWCASVAIPASATVGRDPMRCLCARCAGVAADADVSPSR